MALVVSPVTPPSDLAGATNGYLTEQLTEVWFQGRGKGKLHKQMARSWLAFAFDCYEATGVVLSAVSLGDAYRSYQNQEAVFRLRYTTTPVVGTKSVRYWQGQNWYLKLGFAQVATPGTSNHGWGLAIDMCEIRPGPTVVYIASSMAWGWILANAARYGFSWEAQSEPWHIRLCTGDRTPQAVLDYENPPLPPTPPTPEPPVYDDDMKIAVMTMTNTQPPTTFLGYAEPAPQPDGTVAQKFWKVLWIDGNDIRALKMLADQRAAGALEYKYGEHVSVSLYYENDRLPSSLHADGRAWAVSDWGSAPHLKG